MRYARNSGSTREGLLLLLAVGSDEPFKLQMAILDDDEDDDEEEEEDTAFFADRQRDEADNKVWCCGSTPIASRKRASSADNDPPEAGAEDEEKEACPINCTLWLAAMRKRRWRACRSRRAVGDFETCVCCRF